MLRSHDDKLTTSGAGSHEFTAQVARSAFNARLYSLMIAGCENDADYL